MVGPTASFGAVYADVVGSLGLSVRADETEKSLWHVWAEMDREIPVGTDRYSHYPGGEDEYWLRFASRVLEKATGRKLDDGLAAVALDRIREAFMARSAWEVFPDVVPALEQLRADGARLAVVSNWDSRLPHVLELLDLAPYFDEFAISFFEGVEKPDPQIFHRVLERMDAEPGMALHVGDVPDLDLAGARAAGVDTVLVDRRGKLDAALRPLEDLSALPRIARGDLEWLSR